MESLFENLPATDRRGAVISDDCLYRYKLWRIWDSQKPSVMFLMLNPSTADSNEDDPTIRRCINFAKSWGYGGLYVGNLYAFRSTDPKALKTVSDPIGPENLKHVSEMVDMVDAVVYAWGANARIYKELLRITGSKSYYIALTKDQLPRHPLYLRGDLRMKPFIEIRNKLESQKDIDDMYNMSRQEVGD